MAENEPTIQLPEQQERLQASYKFVLAYHQPKFADQISAAIKDCDTVAFEYVGIKSEAERQAWNEKLTRYVASDTTEAQREAVQDELTESAGGPFLEAILENLQGSDKKITLLDINEDDPNYPLIIAYWTTQREYYKAINDASSIQEVKQATLNHVQAAVDSFGVREEAMAVQLKALGQAPGTIGVVTGVIHTPVMEKLSGIADTSSIVIGPESKIIDGIQVTDYDDLDRVIQQARLNGIENVEARLLNRSVLKAIISSYDIDFGDNDGDSLISTLDTEQMERLLDKIDTIRVAANSQYKGIFRMIMAKNEIVEALQAVWPTIPDNPKVSFRKRG